MMETGTIRLVATGFLLAIILHGILKIRELIRKDAILYEKIKLIFKETVAVMAVAVSITGYFILAVNSATIDHMENKLQNNSELLYEEHEVMGMGRMADPKEIGVGMALTFFSVLVAVPVLVFFATIYLCLAEHSGKNCSLFGAAFSSVLMAHASLFISYLIGNAKTDSPQKMLIYVFIIFFIFFVSGGIYYQTRKRKECLALEHRIYLLTGILYAIPGIWAEYDFLTNYMDYSWTLF